MGGIVLIAIVALVIWGVLHFNKQQIAKDQSAHDALRAAEQERDELRERVKVLERIVTDNNTPSAIEKKQLADEIEDLREDTKQ